MDHLLLIPSVNGYGVQVADGFISTNVEGGANRSRADILGGPSIASVTFECNINEYDYLMAFFRKNKGADFTCELIFESSERERYVCQVQAGSKNLNEQSGLSYVFSCVFEVLPLTDIFTSDFDESIIALFEFSDGDPDYYSASIHETIVRLSGI